MNEEVNLTNCDREPIHIPGSVQPFGFLLAVLRDFTIGMASDNVGGLLGADAETFAASCMPLSMPLLAARQIPAQLAIKSADIARFAAACAKNWKVQLTSVAHCVAVQRGSLRM